MGDTVRTPRRDVAPEVADSRGRPKPERSFCRKVPQYSPMAGFALTAAGWNPRWVRPVTATTTAGWPLELQPAADAVPVGF